MAPWTEARVNGAVRLEGRWEEAYEGSKAPVVGGAGSRATLRFNGTSVSLWGSAHAKSSSSKQSKVSYRCTVDGAQRRTTTHLTTPRQTSSELCHSSNLPPGEHILEFEVDDAVHAEVILENFTIQEDSRSLVPRDLVVVPISIIEVVVMGEDVRTINGTPTTVGWKVVGTNTVTETGTPFVVSDTNTGTSTSSEATPTTEPPPPPPPTTSQETTPPPPPPTTTSQSSAPTTAPSSSSRVTSISRVESTPSQSTPSTASISFVTYSTSSSPEQSGLPETTAGSATAGESRSLAPGAIVGIALGALTIVATAAIIGWIIYLRQKRYQRTPRPLTVPSSGTVSPYDTPHAFPADRKLPIVDNVTGTPSSGNSMSAGTQGLSYTNSSVPLLPDQAYVPVTASPPAPLSAHPFLQEDPMARSDDGHSMASPPTYYERPPTYHERQSTISRPGYF